ncbi:MAG TPA: gamma-glutamyl-gamma-aminobutyrate hydrolase family protein [Candidatus Methylomirabilis sp.]|jgi:putative glutamine amidotransferase|nr:gamma-glutamyl-gamma-aminobutyrate hydrolase family protein [Candidatus Methylomirabilis sp.]
MRPLIGITVHCAPSPEGGHAYGLAAEYAEAVAAAGGLPLLLPVLQDAAAPDAMLARLDGLLLSGGGDLPAEAFSTSPSPPLAETNPVRYRFERALLGVALASDLPILGICRGHQMLNEAAGGSLILNIALEVPQALEHRQSAPGWQPAHGLRVAEEGRLAGLDLPRHVNSFHRQAVREPGAGFVAVAWSPDGLVEAIETPGPRFALGLQFHPEKLWPREPAWLTPFRALVVAAAH